MTQIGKFNHLKVVKLVDFGAYLDGGNNVEILLPTRYINEILRIGDYIDVFIYTDSDDRLIATTEAPLIEVGQFAYLRVKQVNNVGAFLDWGLSKDLLVPFREQRTTMKEGDTYLVYAYLDDNTKRVVASSKIDKFLGNKIPIYEKGDSVKALVYQKTDIGFKAIVDDLYHGMIYLNEIFFDISVGDKVTAYIKNVRCDGKIDLTLSDCLVNRTDVLSKQILDWLKISGGKAPIGDKTSPDEIKSLFKCSKKDFKRAIGSLYKQRLINITTDGIEVV